MNERNGKRENLYNMMQKRFVDLETVENRARNKLVTLK